MVLKSYVLAILSLFLCFSSLFAQTIVKGDMNDDGNVSISDVSDVVATVLGEKAMQTITISDNSTTPICYNAADYNVLPTNTDNTPQLQALVDKVSEQGGGIIFIPKGTYNFKKSGKTMFSKGYPYSIAHRSNVSIIGAGQEVTILKQTDNGPYILFGYFGTASSPIQNCLFSGFSVDAYETGNTNFVYGKAFFFQFLLNCVFRDLTLKGTIATAMGVDFLNKVTIDHINCIDCGRTYTGTQYGTSGIGIGTGGWEEENYTITNCVCEGSGQYGIFIENQYVRGWAGGAHSYSNGVVIANNTVRNGLNKGIGVRGGKHVVISNNNIYGNKLDGIYLDSNCMDVTISDNNIMNNSGCGIRTEMLESKYVSIQHNNIIENEGDGIKIDKGTTTRNASVINQSFITVRDNNIHNNSSKSINITVPVTNPIVVNNISIGNVGYNYGTSATLINQNNIEQ